MPRRRSLDRLRESFAERVTRAGWVTDPRIERAFATIPREAFLPPPPWTVFPPGGWTKTPTTDPGDLYDDVLVVLDAARGVNNGQPSLHAAWLAAVDPKPGETAIHVGAGSGYYTALLSLLVLPGGRVHAYEIDERLADLAQRSLSAMEHVSVHAASAIGGALPSADVIYVNAGLAAPEVSWLQALRPGGRLIFPWQPFGPGGVALLVTRVGEAFRAKPAMLVGFVDCAGVDRRGWPDDVKPDAFARTRSLWPRSTREPDASATAVCRDVWFSEDEV